MPSSPTSPKTARQIQFGKLALAGLSLTMLAACGKVDRLATTSSTVPFDYQKRHPIVLADKPFVTKIFPTNSGISRSDRERIADLARRYAKDGRGPVMIEFPSHGFSGRGSLNQIRSILASNGARGRLRVSTYQVVDTENAAPVRVSFIGLGAKVATRCGEWPDDLASASSLDGWNNKPYWNLGCSYQTMIAAQASDPRDVASPRGEAPPDVEMRIRAIGNVRKGEDPATKWQVKNTTISTAGGN